MIPASWAPTPAPPRRQPSVADRVQAAEVLGVRPDAPREVIRSAWRDAARHHHPDRGGDAERFRAVSDAYRLLAEAPASGAWPALGQLPEGAVELELAESRGLAWRCVASDGDRTITAQFFSLFEHDTWTSMVLDVGGVTAEPGEWSPRHHDSTFIDAARRACRWAFDGRWLVREPMPAADAPVSRWLWQVFSRSCDERQLLPDRESAVAVARELDALASRFEAEEWSKPTVLAAGVGFIARALVLLEAGSDPSPLRSP